MKTIVEEHRVAREGKKDRVREEVKYSRLEWAIMMTGAALIAVLVSAVNNTEYPTNLLGVIAFSLVMMAVFAFVIWDVVSVLAIYHARKKGTIVREAD